MSQAPRQSRGFRPIRKAAGGFRMSGSTLMRLGPDVVRYATGVSVWGRWLIWLVTVAQFVYRPGFWYHEGHPEYLLLLVVGAARWREARDAAASAAPAWGERPSGRTHRPGRTSMYAACNAVRSPPLLAPRPGNGEAQRVGQFPAVPGADGPLGVAIRGCRQFDGHVPVALRLYRDAPGNVAGLVRSLRPLHGPARYIEGVGLQGPRSSGRTPR